MTFSERVKILREKRGWTQQDLANKLQISRSSVANYESNRKAPREDTLIAMADLFNTSTDYLLGRTDEPHPLGYDPDKLEAIFASRKDSYMDELSEADQKQLDKILKEIAHFAVQRRKKENGEDGKA